MFDLLLTRLFPLPYPNLYKFNCYFTLGCNSGFVLRLKDFNNKRRSNMPVSALIVQVKKKKETEVETRINSIPGLEVYARSEGQLITITDSSDSRSDYELIETINRIEYVLQTSLVFSATEQLINQPGEGYEQTQKNH